MGVFKALSFIFLGWLIINVLSFEILQKYGTLKTWDDHIVFESKDFSIGDEMYFSLKTVNYCDDYLYYQYYDNIDDINDNIDPTYYVIYDSKSSVTVNGVLESLTKSFIIEKKGEDLNGLNGNYLYLKFDCPGSVEIENTKSSGKSTIIIIIIVLIVVVLAIIIIFIVIFFCCCKKARALNRLPNIPQNYGYQVNPYYQQMPVYPQYVNNAMVYQMPSSIPNIVYVNSNNANNYNMPQNVPVVENQINQPIPKTSTNREIYEKPNL